MDITKKQYKSIYAKTDDGTITLTITLPQEQVQKIWEQEIEKTVQSAKLPGFRPGKAPRKLVEEKLDKEKIREDVLKKLLPTAYSAAIHEHTIKPIINPKIHVEKIEDGNDWVFSAQTCEIPEVRLNKYKEAIQKITAKSKIIIPGREQKKPSFDQINEAMLKEIEVKIPKILIDGEIERQLAQLLGEIKKLGLSLDQYLASTGKTPQSLRDDYAKKAETDITLEFAIQKIAEIEKIVVESQEIEEAILKAKDDNERKQLSGNRYLLANILRQQKTLDFLNNL